MRGRRAASFRTGGAMVRTAAEIEGSLQKRGVKLIENMQPERESGGHRLHVRRLDCCEELGCVALVDLGVELVVDELGLRDPAALDDRFPDECRDVCEGVFDNPEARERERRRLALAGSEQREIERTHRCALRLAAHRFHTERREKCEECSIVSH